VSGKSLFKYLKGAKQHSKHRLTLNVLWKTQNQQNKNIKNCNLVAPTRSPASTIVLGGDASLKPKHLSFLIGGTGNKTAT
jgi:hypothetical protein